MGSQSRGMTGTGKKIAGSRPSRMVRVDLNHNPDRVPPTKPYADYLRERYSAVRKPKEDKR
jgi:hypothetical protein